MKIISIDVGTINLAVCVVDGETQHILKWELINITDHKNTFFCCHSGCSKPSTFVYQQQHYCTPHAKHFTKTPLKLQSKHIQSLKVAALRELMKEYNIEFESSFKKKQLLQCIDTFVSEHYLDKIKSEVTKFQMIPTSKIIRQKFDCFLSEFDDNDSFCVIIENQMGNVTSKMKAVEGMVVQYFTMSNLSIVHMECISSVHKLKDYSIPPKTTKSERKKIAKQICLDFISNTSSPNHLFLDFYRNHKKKDDLADSLLQSLWFIRHRISTIIH